MTPEERQEDLDYVRVDLALPVEQQCGHRYPKWGRVCSRRKGHVSTRHRSAEVSWTDEMAQEAY